MRTFGLPPLSSVRVDPGKDTERPTKREVLHLRDADLYLALSGMRIDPVDIVAASRIRSVSIGGNKCDSMKSWKWQISCHWMSSRNSSPS